MYGQTLAKTIIENNLGLSKNRKLLERFFSLDKVSSQAVYTLAQYLFWQHHYHTDYAIYALMLYSMLPEPDSLELCFCTIVLQDNRDLENEYQLLKKYSDNTDALTQLDQAHGKMITAYWRMLADYYCESVKKQKDLHDLSILQPLTAKQMLTLIPPELEPKENLQLDQLDHMISLSIWGFPTPVHCRYLEMPFTA